jgi:hypothetical protein
MKGKDEIVDTVSQYLLEAKAVDAAVNSLVWSIALIVTDSDKLYMSKAFQTFKKKSSINHWLVTESAHSSASAAARAGARHQRPHLPLGDFDEVAAGGARWQRHLDSHARSVPVGAARQSADRGCRL